MFKISWVSISNTPTTAVHYLLPTAFNIVHRGEFSVFYMELCINSPFLIMPVIIAYLSSNYLLYSKLWRRAAGGLLSSNTTPPPRLQFILPELHHQRALVLHRDSIFVKQNPFGINFEIVFCRPIPSNVNLQKERPVCMSFPFEGHGDHYVKLSMRWCRGWVRTGSVCFIFKQVK